MTELFELHLLNEQGIAKANEVKTLFEVLFEGLDKLMPKKMSGDQYRTMCNKLEGACFLAKKCIAMDKSNQVE